MIRMQLARYWYILFTLPVTHYLLYILPHFEIDCRLKKAQAPHPPCS